MSYSKATGRRNSADVSSTGNPAQRSPSGIVSTVASALTAGFSSAGHSRQTSRDNGIKRQPSNLQLSDDTMGHNGSATALADTAFAIRVMDAIRTNNPQALLQLFSCPPPALPATLASYRTPAPTSSSLLHLIASFGSASLLQHIFTTVQTTGPSGSGIFPLAGDPFANWLNSYDGEGLTALHRASIVSRLEVVQTLLNQPLLDDSCRALAPSRYAHKTAMDVARSAPIKSALEKAKQSFIQHTIQQALAASVRGDLPTLQALYKQAKVNHWVPIHCVIDPQTGDSILHVAARRGRVDVLQWALQVANANVYAVNIAKQTVLEVAGTDPARHLLREGICIFNFSNSFPLAMYNALGPKKSHSDLTPAANQNTRMEGYLFKWTNYSGGYKKRYFVMEQGVLSYYKSQSDYPHSCRGAIHLQVARLVVDANDRQKFDVLGKESVRYHLKAENAAEASRWVIALTEAKQWIDFKQGQEAVGANANTANDATEAEEEDLKQGDVTPPNNGQEESNDLLLQQQWQSQIMASQAQLDAQQQLMTSFRDYILHVTETTNSSITSTQQRKLVALTKDCYQSIMTITAATRELLQSAEKRELYWQKRFQIHAINARAFEQSLQVLAAENNQLTEAIPEEEPDDLFFDAVEQDLGASATATSTKAALSPKEETAPSDSVVAVSTNGAPLQLVSSSLKGYPIQNRQQLPPHGPPPSVSLWSVLKNSLGKELSRMAIPISFNEPISMLQRLCEDMEYASVLAQAARRPSAHERIAFVAAFAASSYSSTDGRTGKPFNPLLGETFEYVSRMDGFRYVSEQVSHHPPISACYCESDEYIYWSEVNVKTRFYGKSLEVVPAGISHIILKPTMEHFSWKKVTTCINNIIFGSLWIDHYGDLVVTNHKTRDTCTLTFHPTKRGKVAKSVDGVVRDGPTGQDVFRIAGTWADRLVMMENNNTPVSHPIILWKRAPLPPDAKENYNFTAFAASLNESSSDLENFLCPTDSRRRPDQRAMELGDYDRASNLKSDLEHEQRLRRKAKEASGHSASSDEYRPSWFVRDVDEDTGEDTWVYVGGYWESRESGQWPDQVLRDIYLIPEKEEKK